MTDRLEEFKIYINELTEYKASATINHVTDLLKEIEEQDHDWQKKGLIFNPETGISEDGTMHDGVYRPWINQPKKEKKMTREEAIEYLERYRESTMGFLLDRKFGEAIDRFKQPPTLADFLGWEEGQEYLLNDAEYWHPRIKVENDKIYHFHEDDKRWFEKKYVTIDYINDYRQAKKVEKPKLKAYHVKDEYSFDCLLKELEEEGYMTNYGIKLSDWKYTDIWNYVYVTDELNKRVDYGSLYEIELSSYDLIEYHKEEPKYKWRFKSVKANRINGKVLYFHHAEDCDLILDSYPNVRYMTENLLRAELRGTRFDVDDFERVE